MVSTCRHGTECKMGGQANDVHVTQHHWERHKARPGNEECKLQPAIEVKIIVFDKSLQIPRGYLAPPSLPPCLPACLPPSLCHLACLPASVPPCLLSSLIHPSIGSATLAVFSSVSHIYLCPSLIVAASMNGGGVLAEFVHMIIQWTSELDKTHRMNPLRRKTPTQTSVHLYFQDLMWQNRQFGISCSHTSSTRSCPLVKYSTVQMLLLIVKCVYSGLDVRHAGEMSAVYGAVLAALNLSTSS